MYISTYFTQVGDKQCEYPQGQVYRGARGAGGKWSQDRVQPSCSLPKVLFTNKNQSLCEKCG